MGLVKSNSAWFVCALILGCYEADFSGGAGAIPCRVDSVVCPLGTTCHRGFCLVDDASRDGGVSARDGGIHRSDAGGGTVDSGAAPPNTCWSLEFDGTTGRIGLGSRDDPLGVERDFTLGVWLNLQGQTLSHNLRILDVQNHNRCGDEVDPQSAGFACSISTDRGVNCALSHADRHWLENWVRTPAAVVPADGWFHLVFTRSASEASVWVDGQKVHERNDLTTAALHWPVLNTNRLSWVGYKGAAVGCAQDGLNYQGRMRDLIVWSQPMDDATVENLWQHVRTRGEQGSGGFEALHVAAHWLMNEGSGSTTVASTPMNGELSGALEQGVAWVEDCPKPFARSCAAIKQAQPDAASGIYFIDPNGADDEGPFRVYCEMTKRAGGWALAMKLKTGSTELSYDAPYWETAQLLNEGDLTPNSEDSPTQAKFASYNHVSGSELWVEFVSLDRNLVFEGLQGRTLLELFQGSENRIAGTLNDECNASVLTQASSYDGELMRFGKARQFYGVNGSNETSAVGQMGGRYMIRFGFGSVDAPGLPWRPFIGIGLGSERNEGFRGSLSWVKLQNCSSCGCYGQSAPDMRGVPRMANVWVR